MKTTIELPDHLFIEAKTAAARRRSSLKDLIISALSRELHPPSSKTTDNCALIERSPNDIPRLKHRGVKVTSDMVYQMLENEGC